MAMSKKKIDSESLTLKKVKGYTFSSYLAINEMKLARLEMPGSNLNEKYEIEDDIRLAKQTLFNIKYDRLTKPDKDGTPTGIIIKKYIANLFMRGLHLKGNETLWARFSCGEVTFRSRYPEEQINLRVLEDMNQAMQKQQEEYEIRMANGNVEDFF